MIARQLSSKNCLCSLCLAAFRCLSGPSRWQVRAWYALGLSRHQHIPSFFYTEQMDAEGLGRKLLLTPSGDPRRAPEKQTVGNVTTSHKMLSLQALSSSLNAGGLPGPRRGSFGCPPAVCPPKRPRPFAHYRFLCIFHIF